MSTQLLCPNCGHHVADLTETRTADPLDKIVREWVDASGLSGNYTARGLYDNFIASTGVNVSMKAWGDAMRRAGVMRRKSNGVRGWRI